LLYFVQLSVSLCVFVLNFTKLVSRMSTVSSVLEQLCLLALMPGNLPMGQRVCLQTAAVYRSTCILDLSSATHARTKLTVGTYNEAEHERTTSAA
jgi:hypothetical protein